MRTIEASAKTIDQAIMQGLEELGVEMDQVDLQILSEGGIFKKAKVRLTVKEEAVKEEPKFEIKEEIKPAEIKEKKAEKKEEVKREVKEVKAEKENRASVNNGGNNKYDVAENFVAGLLKALDSKCAVTRNEKESTVELSIDGEDVGALIGKGGAVMKAIEQLAVTVAINAGDRESKKRVTVNCASYKERREENLIRIADKTVERVKATGRYIKLDPMNSYERRIIHAHLQEVEGIKTFSSGEEPRRCICIAPKDKD